MPVKRAVDESSSPGRFLLTGSVRGHLDTEMWPGTGRLVHLRMWGLTVSEILGSSSAAPFLQTLAQGDIAAFRTPADTPDLRGYVELALRGGYPEPALRLRGLARQARMESYLGKLLSRDAESLGGIRDPQAAQALLRSARREYGRCRYRQDVV